MDPESIFYEGQHSMIHRIWTPIEYEPTQVTILWGGLYSIEHGPAGSTFYRDYGPGVHFPYSIWHRHWFRTTFLCGQVLTSRSLYRLIRSFCSVINCDWIDSRSASNVVSV